MWIPRIAGSVLPKYKAIAQALVDDVANGRLAPGTQLPTHRELAERLGVTVGTITRAYADAAERGVLDATVGRGTFVRARRPTTFELPHAGVANLAMNRPVMGPHQEALAHALAELARDDAVESLLDYAPPAGLPRHREAGARFFAETGSEVDAAQVVVASGAQGALGAAVSALTDPGDVVAVEALSYPGILSALRQSRRVVQGLEMDSHGVVPAAFDAACRARRPRLFMCVPNLHNPTAIVVPEERRRELVAIARAHDVLVLEDDVYGFLVERRPPSLRELAPERTCTVTSLSKALIPGLRIGFVAAPPPLVERIAAAIRVASWMALPLAAEIAARWMEDGTARRLMAFQVEEAKARQEIAARLLARFSRSSNEASFHLWLRLPEQFTVSAFCAAVRERGVSIAAPESFAAGVLPEPPGVRLSVVGPRSRDELERALRVVVSVLDSEPSETLVTI